MSTSELIATIEAKAYLREPSKANKAELYTADIWLDVLHLINKALEGKVIVPINCIEDAYKEGVYDKTTSPIETDVEELWKSSLSMLSTILYKVRQE